MKMSVKIGGVPEYFNLPFYHAIEQGYFESQGIDVQWTDVKEGTGAMAKKLDSGALDLAIILTEGAIKSIVEGSSFKIAGTYVASPLSWGIHVPPNMNITALDDLKTRQVAISRINSGSHLMSFLLAERQGWDRESLNFKIVNHLDGAIASFQQNETNLFLWEKFTTQPFVDQGYFHRIDTIPTPWPCFMIAVNNTFAAEQGKKLESIFKVLEQSILEINNSDNLPERIVRKFSLSLSQAQQAVRQVRWVNKVEPNSSMLDEVYEKLISLRIMPKTRSNIPFCIH